MYPNETHPTLGTFVKSQIDSLREFVDIELFIVKGLGGILPYLIAVPGLLRKLYFSDYDVIHIHYGNIASMVKLLYWGTKPIVTSYCGDDLFGTYIAPGKRTRKSILFMKLNIFMSRRDTVSITKSKAMAGRLPEKKNLYVIPNGVDIELFRPIDKKEALNKLGLDPNERIFLFPADPGIPLKNYEMLQRVMMRLKDLNIGLLTFAGNKVSRSMVPYYFSSADLIVFTSLSEGSPNVIKEAMASNCNIYTTNCGDVTWLLDSVRGSKVLSYNEDEWEREIRAFVSTPVTEPDSRSKLIEKQLDSRSIARKIADIYNSLTSKS